MRRLGVRRGRLLRQFAGGRSGFVELDQQFIDGLAGGLCQFAGRLNLCLLHTSDAADDALRFDLGGLCGLDTAHALSVSW